MTEARQYYCSRCLTTFPSNPEVCTNMGCGRDRPERGWGEILRSGDVFDRNYKIHRMLAMGGAGVTYLARELDDAGDETGPEVAIKVLLAARDAGNYVRRLSTEAQIIQELDHPHIVRYLGFVHRTGRSPYLITRFEEGGCLLDHMRRVGTLSVLQTAVVGQQICRALVEAHRREIVHRDLKPENVLLERQSAVDEDLVVRVADFGIAKIQGSLNSNLTRVGSFVGTPHFAAPEQFLGQPVTQASDIYSTGALMHFCMSAQHVCKDAHRAEPQVVYENLLEVLPVTLPASAGRENDVIRMQRILALAMDPIPERRLTAMELNRMCGELLAGRDPQSPERLRTGLGLGDAILQASHTMADESFSVLDAAISSSPIQEKSTTRLNPVSTKEDGLSASLPVSHGRSSRPVETADRASSGASQSPRRGGFFLVVLCLLFGAGSALGWVYWDEIQGAVGLDDHTSDDPNGDDGKSKADRDDDEEKSVGKEARESSRTESAREQRQDVADRLEVVPDEEDTPLSNVEAETIDQSLNVNVSAVEQFVETVHYRYRGSATEFAPVAQQAALNMAAQKGWSYKGRNEKPPLPTCQKGICKGSFQGRFERTVVR